MRVADIIEYGTIGNVTYYEWHKSKNGMTLYMRTTNNPETWLRWMISSEIDKQINKKSNQ